MAGGDPLSYLPLDKGALVVSPGLEDWIRSWWGGSPLITLDPEGWFTRGHGTKGYLWAPPPAAMEVALECLDEAILKRPDIPNVVVAPRLMTHLWQKQLGKDVDLMFSAPAGLSFWPASCHEPLIIAVLLPVVLRRNWRGPWVGFTEVVCPAPVRMNWSGASRLPWEANPLDGLLWEGNCARCGKTLLRWGGIFCVNFCARRGDFKPCRKA